MVIGDGPTSGTGFGEELRQVLFRLVQHGHEVVWLALNYLGYPIDLHDFLFPDLPHKNAKIIMVGNWGKPQNFGADIFPRHYKEFVPDIILLMGDPYRFDRYLQLKKQMGFPLLFLCTLDGLPIPEHWRAKLTVPDVLITMTNWARNCYAKAGIKSVTINHGIDWSWWSTTQENKKRIKQKFGIPESTVIYADWNLNQHRKRPDAELRCWKQFRPETKDVKLLLYTDWQCRLGFDYEGVDPFTKETYGLIKDYKIPRDSVIGPNDLLGDDKAWECPQTSQQIKDVVQMGDISISCTSGEGWGKTFLESQSLGMPVVVTKCSSLPEVVGNAGILVPTYRGRAGKFRWHDNVRRVEGAVVNERLFTEALNRMYSNTEEREKLSLIAREHAQLFDYEKHIIPRWLTLLDKINPDLLLARDLGVL